MKKILLLILAGWLTGCQKDNGPAPIVAEPGKVGNMLVLAAVIKDNKLQWSYEYADGRLVRTYYFGRPDKSYSYNDEQLQTKVISGNSMVICQFNEKGVRLWKDEYMNNQFKKRITYQYRNKVFIGTQTTPAAPGTTDTRMIYKNPWDYQSASITIGSDGMPGEPTLGSYYRWFTPTY